MPRGVFIFGLNGCGKTTLGRALSRMLDAYALDVEDFYFPIPGDYAVHRDRREVARMMLAEMRRHERFVLSCVNGDWGNEIESLCACAVLLSAPPEVRLARIKARSLALFGARSLPGGDLYGQERAFLQRAASRTGQPIEEWLSSLACPVLRLDGALPVEENARRVALVLGGRL